MANLIAKSKEGVFTAHEISDVTTVDRPAGLYVNPSKQFVVDDFIEETYRDADAYFFPLGESVLGFTPEDSEDDPSIAPVHSTNIARDENGVFVGPATVNLWPDKTIMHGFQPVSAGNVSKIYCTPAGINTGVSLTQSNNSDDFNSLSISNTADYTGTGVYTISSYIRDGGNGNILYSSAEPPENFYLSQGIGGAAIANTLIRQEPVTLPISTQWSKVIRTANYTGPSVSMTPNITWRSIQAQPSEFRLYGMQLEKLAFATPYTPYSRSASQLTYNLNSSIGLDWSSPWTIMYWKRPSGTDNALAGYSVESLGMNGNTVGTGYLWWGKVNNINSISFSGSSPLSGLATFDWNNYQYNWQLVSVKYDGINKLKFSIFGVNDDPIVFERTQVIPSANYFVNQNNYDFQLGGFDLSHQPAASYRGLAVYKRELTDEFVTKYYNTKLKMFETDGKLTIYSSIILEEDL